MKENLEKICVWNTISKKESKIKGSLNRIQGYKEKGCYNCSGKNKDCDNYMFIAEVIKCAVVEDWVGEGISKLSFESHIKPYGNRSKK